MLKLLLHAMPYRGLRRKNYDIYECISAHSSPRVAHIAGNSAGAALVFVPGIVVFLYGAAYVLARVLLRQLLREGQRLGYFDSLYGDIEAAASYFSEAIPYAKP